MSKWYLIKNDDDLQQYKDFRYEEGRRMNNPITIATAQSDIPNQPEYPFFIGGSMAVAEILIPQTIDAMYEELHRE